MAVEPRRYQFGPLERRGVVLGLRGGQVAVVGSGAAIAVAALRAARGPTGAVVAMGAVVVAGVASFCPVGGATLEQWAPTLAGWFAGWAPGRRWVSQAPLEGRVDAPTALAGVDVLETSLGAGGRPIGVLRDRRSGTYSALLAVRGASFALLDIGDKERRLSAWAGIVASLGRSGSPVSRIQWVERSLPAGPERLQVPAEHSGLPEGCAASYADLVAEAGPVTQDHEVLLVLSVSERHAARAIRRRGGGADGACDVLARELRLLDGQLRAAEILVDRVLSRLEVVRSLRRAYEPERSPEWGSGWRSAGTIWPLATEVEWSSYRTDGVWHATYWVAEWPGVEVGPDFLAPLLLQSQGRRTVALTMCPTPPAEAARAVEAARTADIADDELRRRSGFLSTARRRRESEHVVRREAELAEGHVECRFAGYVTVTAGDPDALDRSCAEVEQAAHQSHLHLRRLFGRQEEAFTWTLPLGRGVR